MIKPWFYIIRYKGGRTVGIGYNNCLRYGYIDLQLHYFWGFLGLRLEFDVSRIQHG